MTRLRLLRIAFQQNILAIPARAVIFFAVLLLFLVPFVTQDSYILTVVIYTNIFAIFAASWDILGGYTGVFSLAHGVLFGTAAYTAGLLNTHLGLPPWLTIPAGAFMAALVGLIMVLPAIRLRGIYFCLVSMALPLIATGIVLAFPGLTGGEYGISGITPLASSKLVAYYIILLIMVVSGVIMWKLMDTRSAIVRLGIMLQAIREDEIAARAVGMNTTRLKILAFGISGFFAGIAGGLYTHTIRVAGPSVLDLMFAFYPLLWTTFGAVGTIIGPIVGTYMLYPAVEALRAVPEIRLLVFACLIIAVLYFMPEGVFTWFRSKVEVRCPRCKLINVAIRRTCRACDTPLHLEREESKSKEIEL